MAVGDAGAVITREGDKWRTAPRPTNTNIYDITGLDWQHIWAICAEGVLFFDGSRWTLTPTGPYSRYGRYDRIYCRAPDDVMVVTDEYESLHFDGRTWARQHLPVRGGDSDWLLGWSDGYTAVGGNGRSVTWSDGTWGPVEVAENADDFRHIVLTRNHLSMTPDAIPMAVSTQWDKPGEFKIHVRQGFDNWYLLDTHTIDGTLLDIVSDWQDEDFYIVSRSVSRDTVRIHKRWSIGYTASFPGLNDATAQIFRNRLDYSDRSDQFVLAGPYGSFYTGNEEDGIESSLGGFSFEPHEVHVWPNGDFVATDNNTQLLYGRGGQVSVQTETLPGYIQEVWGPNPEVAYGVGSKGLIVRLTPDAPPEQMTSPTTRTLNAVWGRSDSDIWAGGTSDFLHFDGSTWNSIPIPEQFSCFGLTGTASGDVYVQGNDRIWRWDGTDWTEELSSIYYWIDEIAAAPGGHDLFVKATFITDIDADSSILRLRNGEWEGLPALPLGTRDLVALSDDSVMIAAAEACFQLQDNAWQPVPYPLSEAGEGRAWKIFGNSGGGIYSISTRYSIHHLDLGGTGLWQ